jgi:hypothetical protein
VLLVAAPARIPAEAKSPVPASHEALLFFHHVAGRLPDQRPEGEEPHLSARAGGFRRSTKRFLEDFRVFRVFEIFDPRRWTGIVDRADGESDKFRCQREVTPRF